jgi:NAD(P)-dependent dehydrogenase (short-subunit alcohol dehydrogenase family)
MSLDGMSLDGEGAMSSISFDPDAVAVLTGAGGGIGAATARRFAQGGASVALIDANDSVHEVSEGLSKEFPELRFESWVADVTNEEALAGVRAGVVEKFGRVDHLGIIAGVVQTAAAVEDLTLEEWNRVFGVNSIGAFLTAKTFIPELKKRPEGTIVAIASYWARTNPPLFAAYSASKSTVLSMVQTMAAELAPSRIRVNAVAPGQINTGMHRNALTSEAESRGITFEEMKAIEWGKIPLGVAGDPEVIADAVAFLSSPAASYITGASLDVNGGVVFH